MRLAVPGAPEIIEPAFPSLVYNGFITMDSGGQGCHEKILE